MSVWSESRILADFYRFRGFFWFFVCRASFVADCVAYPLTHNEFHGVVS